MLEIRLLGRFEVKLDGRAIILSSRPAQSLLAYLALSAGTAHRREKLAGLLWPDSSDDQARRNLRQSLWQIRKTLGEAAAHYLHSDDITVTFAAVNYWLDVALLEKPADAHASVEELMAVVAVYGGELLPGFYDDWVLWQRERQQTLFECKMEHLLDRLTAVRRWDDLLEWGERWLALGQSPEAAYRAVMVAHAGRGDLARMAAVYRRCVGVLENELGVEPSPQTRALFERLSRGQEGDELAYVLFPQRYQLLGEVGRGGMGVVYQAHDTQLKRKVAIKMLTPNMLDADGRARLLREAQAIARLNHPNIVAVFDIGEVDGRPYIVMELVPGHPLRQHRPQTLDESLAITRQICLALEHAHANEVIHRDLKPENILITTGQVVKLMDFGLARTPESPNLTQEGAIVGTFAYLAPEVIQGQPATVQSDLYALGVMLYELATGQPPFAGDNAALVSHHLATAVTPPQRINPALFPPLSDLIERLLSKRPADRPVSATAVREVIERLPSSTSPVTSTPSNNKYRPYLLTQSHQHNLPTQATRFIGREAEVTAVLRLLSRPDVRLLTLTGTGGTGKTRLALQVADESLPDFADGVWFVPLAAITDPTLVAATIGRQLRLQEMTERTWEERLTGYLQDKSLLLVLDNFEQIVSAAPQLAEWLTAAPQIKLLVTSRVSLHLSHEQRYEVLPLTRPDPQQLPPLSQLEQVEAVQLFVERAQVVKATFALSAENAPDVAEICTRLDGLPLAIELAAARSRLMSPQQMRERLGRRLQWLTGGTRDAPARQQTLRATLDWSHDLLPTAEQTLFRRLAVFVGGCTLEAAEAVANTDGNLDVLNGLESLLNHHLLEQQDVAHEPRFTMLETIREYAMEKLAESGEQETVWQQYTAYFVALAETAEPKLRSADQLTWLNRLEIEYHNFVTALQWALLKQEAIELAATLAGVLGEFWAIRGYLSEGNHWLDQVLAQSGRISTRILARVLSAAGWLAFEGGDYERARYFCAESLVRWREVNDVWWIADSLNRLGHAAQQQGDYDNAVAYYEESESLYHQLEDRSGIALALNRLGHLAQLTGNYLQAMMLIEQSLTIRRELGEKRGIASSLNALAEMARFSGDYERACVLYEECLAICIDLGDKRCVAGVSHNLAYVAEFKGDNEQAFGLFKKGLVLYEELDNSEGISLCLVGLASVLAIEGKLEQAALLLGCAEQLFKKNSTVLNPVDNQAWQTITENIRLRLNESLLQAAWRAGQNRPLKDIIHEAIREVGG